MSDTTASETALRAALLDVLVEDAGGVRELADPRDYEDRIAVFLPLLLEVRTAAFTEAADAINALIEELAFREHVSGARARDLLRTLAAASTATAPTHQES